MASGTFYFLELNDGELHVLWVLKEDPKPLWTLLDYFGKKRWSLKATIQIEIFSV